MMKPIPNSLLCAVLIFAHVVVLPVQGRSAFFEACGVFEPIATLPTTDGGVLYYAPPSQVAACVSSFELDPANVTQYLESLIRLTRDYYVFTDVAVDPTLSVPSTTPLGYPLYNGSDAGQVDVIAELEALLQNVQQGQETAVSLDIILEVNEIYAKLFDAHVSVNEEIHSAGMLDAQDVRVFGGERFGGALSVLWRVVFPSEDEEFVLLANITYPDGTSETKQIIELDGKAPLDFFTDLARKPMGFNSFKSLGPRVQTVIRSFVSATILGFGTWHPSPAKFIPDIINVTYQDGTTSNWTTLQVVPHPVGENRTRAEIQAVLAEPGTLYQNYNSALGILSDTFRNATNISSTTTTTTSSARDGDESRHLQQQNDAPSSDIDITMFGNALGVAVMDDYAVLKLSTFSIDPRFPGDYFVNDDDIKAAWKLLTEEAAAKNVDKLIIDLIGNAGGTVAFGYLLAILMFPTATWDDLANPYDQLWSPALQVYQEDVLPLLSSIDESYNNPGMDTEQFDTLLADLNNHSDVLTFRLEVIVQALEALLVVVPDSRANEATLEAAKLIQNSVSGQDPPSISSSEVVLLLQQVQSALQQLSAPGDQSELFSYSDPGAVERNRGGRIGNYSNPFYLLDPNLYLTFHSFATDEVDNPNQFQHYIILGDGDGVGSTANTFQTTASMYAKTHRGSAPTVSLVSYGGTGQESDSAVTQYAGGSVMEAKLDNLYVPDLLLYVLSVLMAETPIAGNITEAVLAFDAAVPDPCYYCNAAPHVTVYQMYSVVVGANSTPVEYVDQRPDYYMRQWPSQTSFQSPGDLPHLYTMTRTFFDRAAEGGGETGTDEGTNGSGETETNGSGATTETTGNGETSPASGGTVVRAWMWSSCVSGIAGALVLLMK